jgi:hypothetical protein
MPSLIQDMTTSRIPKYNGTFENSIFAPYHKNMQKMMRIVTKGESFCEFVQGYSVPLHPLNLPARNKSRDLSDFYDIYKELHDVTESVFEFTKKCLYRQKVACLLYEQCVRKVGFIDIS